MNEKKQLLISRSIPESFAAQVQRTPHLTALKAAETTWSYEQLNRETNCLAWSILSMVGEQLEPVVFLLEQGAEAVIALLGILKAGKIYVSLDPTFAPSHLSRVLVDTEARLIITNNQNHALAKTLAASDQHILNIDHLPTGHSDQDLAIRSTPDTPAVIFYTSGSTGRPKGVVQNHSMMAWSEISSEFVGPGDNCTLMFSCSFAASRGTIFGSLLNGAALLPYNFRVSGLAPLANWLNSEKVTFFQPPIGLFRKFMNSLPERAKITPVRHVCLGGANLFGSDIIQFWEHFSSDCILTHNLGLSETGALARNQIRYGDEIPKGIVPLGYPIEGKEIWLEDESGNRVDDGETGEICVESEFLAREYWHNPELTREKFQSGKHNAIIYRTGDLGRMDASGRMIHLGRKDFMVKIRGYRVEIVEVEAALFAVKGVKEAVVVANRNSEQEKYLVAYVVLDKSHSSGTSFLRKALLEQLPAYMIPSIFIKLDKLPVNPHGKIDHQSLPQPQRVRPELDEAYVVPRTPLETKLADIWAACLNTNQVGIFDEFFDLGGDSLIAAQIVSRVFKDFRVEIPLKTLFESSNVAKMAEQIAVHNTQTLSDVELDLILSEIEILSDEAVQALLDSS